MFHSQFLASSPTRSFQDDKNGEALHVGNASYKLATWQLQVANLKHSIYTKAAFGLASGNQAKNGFCV
ncbi:hypothetical protein TH61_09850 [Rufibacter sp. DG15C]|nr:hypothetical protein TH61_09850 [Rufibacter sp. DG15C]